MTPLRWLLTAAFAVTTVWFVLRTGRTRTPERISHAAHALLAAAMAATVWSWAPAWQAAVFGVATLWFLRRSAAARRQLPGPGLPDLHHAVMAAAMTWMAVAMAAPAVPHHAAPQAALAGMASAPDLMTIMGVPLAAYFLVAAPWWTVRAVRARGDSLCHAVMSAGMGVLLLLR